MAKGIDLDDVSDAVEDMRRRMDEWRKLPEGPEKDRLGDELLGHIDGRMRGLIYGPGKN